MPDETFHCPGCVRELPMLELGGYRSYCQRCVDALPTIPPSGGWTLAGVYPTFAWVAVNEGGTRAVPAFEPAPEAPF